MRDAVVFVHGIGQQRPLATLDAYADQLTGLWDRTPEGFGPEAPTTDQTGGLLRRIKVEWEPPFYEGERSLRTDLYEYHWAHLAKGSRWSHIASFLGALLRRKQPLPSRLRWTVLYLVAISIPFVGAFVALMLTPHGPLEPFQERLNTSLGLGAATVLLGGFVLSSLTIITPTRGPRPWVIGLGFSAVIYGFSVLVGGPRAADPSEFVGGWHWTAWAALVLTTVVLVSFAIKWGRSWYAVAGAVLFPGIMIGATWRVLSERDWVPGEDVLNPCVLTVVFGVSLLIAMILWGVFVRSADWRLSALAAGASVTTLCLGAVALISWIPFGPGDSGDAYDLAARVAGALLVAGVTGFVVYSFGDVARYLNPVPDNIDLIESVREGGVSVLKRLHDSNRYERIIVIGHSMGSLVAYDMVRSYWATVNRDIPFDSDEGADLDTAAGSVENQGKKLWADWYRRDKEPVPRERKYDDPRDSWWKEPNPQGEEIPPAYSGESGRLLKDYLSAKSDLFGEVQKTQRGVWQISDLVTLAFPYAHADYLLAESARELHDLQYQRRFATDPPQPQTSEHRYRFRGGSSGAGGFHHASPFVLTRWTNLYFWSDVVGGPASPLWGPGVDDVRLGTGWNFFFPGIHTVYNRRANSLAELRRIIHGDRTRGTDDLVQLRDRLAQTLCVAVSQLRATLPDQIDVADEPSLRLVQSIPLLRRLGTDHAEYLLELMAGQTSDTEVAERFICCFGSAQLMSWEVSPGESPA